MPSPIPTKLRVAAISTNIGWALAWGSANASAYNVLAAPGTTPAKVAAEVRRALGAYSGLTVETAQAHAGEQRALSRQGLQRLAQIATLILVAAVLAMAAAMGSMVWQRRARLAKLKLEGLPRATLWRTILLESLLLLGVGCLAGAIFGLYGQVLLDRALAQVIGFPVFYSFGGGGGGREPRGRDRRRRGDRGGRGTWRPGWLRPWRWRIEGATPTAVIEQAQRSWGSIGTSAEVGA